jgi:nitrite reductase/ring-hydroxylating ferredoxin subunit
LKRILPLLLALVVLTAGCGRFGSAKKSSSTTLLGDGVGSGLSVPTTATTAAPVTTAAGKTKATVAACPHTDPTSEIEYGGRLRLSLTLSVLCPQHADDIAFTLKVTNISSAPVHYDKNQAQFFSLLAYPSGSGRIRWEDTNCQPPSRDRNAPAATLNPGESITINTLYPAPKAVADREKCRRLQAGDYDANGLFLACDGEAYTDGYCDISKDTQYKAQPIRITVAA